MGFDQRLALPLLLLTTLSCKREAPSIEADPTPMTKGAEDAATQDIPGVAATGGSSSTKSPATGSTDDTSGALAGARQAESTSTGGASGDPFDPKKDPKVWDPNNVDGVPAHPGYVPPPSDMPPPPRPSETKWGEGSIPPGHRLPARD